MSERFLTFNQNKSCFLMINNSGDTGGFTIYNLNPLSERFKRQFNGTLGIVEPYHKSNLFAIVGGGENPWRPPSQVIIWEDYKGKILATIDHSSIVKNVKIYKSFICVVLEKSIKIFDFNTLKKKCTLPTAPNPNGLIAINEKTIIFPGESRGTINVYKINDDVESTLTPILENLKTHENHQIILKSPLFPIKAPSFVFTP